MTTNEPVLSSAFALQTLYIEDCKRFAPDPPIARLDEPCNSVAALSRYTRLATEVAAEDWDLLFCAVLESLTRVALERADIEGTSARQRASSSSLRACIDALDQLRRSVVTAEHHTVAAQGGLHGAPDHTQCGCPAHRGLTDAV